MISRILIAILLLGLAPVAAYDETPSLTFDASQMMVDCNSLTVSYEGFDAVPVGRSILLAAGTFYVELYQAESVADVACSYGEPESIGWFDVDDPFADLATTDSPIDSYRFGQYSQAELMGESPVMIQGEYRCGDKRYLTILIFPATIDASGTITFHGSVTVNIGSRSVPEEALLSSRPEDGTSVWSNEDDPRFGPMTDVVDYVIITSGELAEAASELASYKTSTGYVTEVCLVDDALVGQTGVDDPERLRNYLKGFHDRGGRFVLLVGDETHVPIRHAYPNATVETPDPYELQICDLYYADLTGEWDVDGDSVWGELVHDQADIVPELFVGRLPFSTAEEVEAYIDKLIVYETNPGYGHPDYLERAYFFSSDQMRDYSDGGQHARIAEAYPDHFCIDTGSGVEQDRGDDLSPHNLPAPDLVDTLSSGFGIVNIVAHGSASSFDVRTSGYNNFPKSWFTTDTTDRGLGEVQDISPNGRTSFYYSLACNNGGFDLDTPPFDHPYPNLVQTFLAIEDAGAVGFVANSRWGWVGSSHLLQRAFFDSLFAHPGQPAIEAMYLSKQRYYYIRDVVFGQNFYGDPTLQVYTGVPGQLDIVADSAASGWEVSVLSDGSPVADCPVILSDTSGIIDKSVTNSEGKAFLACEFLPMHEYIIAAVQPDYSVSRLVMTPSIAADLDEDGSDPLPGSFSLSQNYPNPFNPATTIRFDLPKRDHVTLTIYNILGRRVTTLVDESLSSGSHEIAWNGGTDNGGPVASGIYFYRLVSGDYHDQKKMVLMK